MHLREIDANLIVVLDALLMDASVTKAAERLGRSPSAISHALAVLRSVFDDELFVRAGQRLAPTARARELASTVHVIVVGMESLLRARNPFDPANAQRTFAVASTEIGELALLRPLQQALAAIAPGIGIRWEPLARPDGIEDLRQGKTDFVIDPEPETVAAPDLKSVILFADPLVTVARPGHPLVLRKPTLAAFADADHLAIASMNGAASVEAAVAGRGRALRIVAEASSVLSGILLALGTDALVTVPASVLTAMRGHVALAEVKQPFPRIAVPVRLIWHRVNERDECHLWVREQLTKLARGLADTG